MRWVMMLGVAGMIWGAAAAGESPATSAPAATTRVAEEPVAGEVVDEAKTLVQERRVTYVIDIGGLEEKELREIKAEMGRAIGRTTHGLTFRAVLYGGGATRVFPGTGKKMIVNDETRASFLAWMKPIASDAKTGGDATEEAIVAMRSVLEKGPERHNVFLVTSREVGGKLAEAVKEANGKKAQVYGISFLRASPEGAKMLQRVAKENGGRYKFVEEKHLEKEIH